MAPLQKKGLLSSSRVLAAPASFPMEGMTASPRPNRPSFSIALEKPPLTISRLTASATSSCSSPTSSTDSSPTHFRRALSSKLGGRPPDLVAAALAENVAAAGLRARSSPPLYFHPRASPPFTFTVHCFLSSALGRAEDSR